MANSYLIDSHCHIHDTDTYKWFLSRDKKADPADYTPEKLLKRAKDNGVKQMICIGTTHEDSLRAHDFAAQHDGVFWSYGIHPEEWDMGRVVSFGDLAELTSERERGSPVTTSPWDEEGRRPTGRADACSKNNKSTLVAIGEVGLDYHHGAKHRTQQIKLLEQFLQLATDHHLPVIFHVREAYDDFFPVVDNFPGLKAVVHSFSDSQDNLTQALKRDFFIGVNGMATFTNLPLPPLEKTLLETDAPFLAPKPYRGHTNEPALIKDIATFLATTHHITVEQVAAQTTANARQLFRLPDPS